MPSNQSPLGALPARFRRERVLIVGYGDIGQRIARRLMSGLSGSRFVQVLAISRDRARLPALRMQAVCPLRGDLDQPESLRRLAGVATRVLYLAPPPNLREGEERWQRDDRSRALLRALRRGSAPRSLVYASTSGVYGDCQGQWVDETHSLAPATGRAWRRVHAEQGMRSAGRQGLQRMRVSILRIPGIYAPDREGGTPRTRLLRGTAVLRSEDDVYTNHIHAEDLARASLKALWHGRPQRIYHASDDTQLKMGDYFDLAADLYGLPRPPRISREQASAELPATLLSFMSESRRLCNRRLKQELGLKLLYPTVEQGLRG
ncbi:MAG: SDR family oxidoreductase [Comamonas sp.]|uniref:SDR family oxidoreductase n=1 Tax=Comamonas sp. TaxID=34028 RepID=UPI00281920BC|nr:SDR family oxidoreductase [Comamonas sp.]MDR0217039.1 SDR family oxidoreductase [Comamonas sp.]